MSSLLLAIMPPLTNRYCRRFHPFTRPLSLHMEFPFERPSCPLHSLYTIFSTDSDAGEAKSPSPLLSRSAALSAPDYFTSLEMNKPDIVYKKPAGEAGGMGWGGYWLQTALGWLVEIYKKVQVCHSSLFLICSNLCL